MTDTPLSPALSAPLGTIVGEGAFRYEVVENWARIPDGWSLHEVAAVGVDSLDNVYVFNRGAHPVIVLDRDGRFLRSWGEGIFKRPHGLHVAPDDTLFLTDDGDHSVRHCTADGKVLLTLGTPGQPSPFMSGQPFHRCTHTALTPSGDILVSDGYGNARIHKYAPDGRHLLSWGGSGIDPGQFNIPHNIVCDADGWVYVADRESHRIQVFDVNGRFETQWNTVHRPSALCLSRCGCPLCYVGELGPPLALTREFPNLGPRLSVLDMDGKVLARIGASRPGLAPDQFIGPHGIAVDKHGDLYIGEVSRTFWGGFWPRTPIPDNVRCLRKLRRLPQ